MCGESRRCYDAFVPLPLPAPAKKARDESLIAP